MAIFAPAPQAGSGDCEIEYLWRWIVYHSLSRAADRRAKHLKQNPADQISGIFMPCGNFVLIHAVARDTDFRIAGLMLVCNSLIFIQKLFKIYLTFNPKSTIIIM